MSDETPTTQQVEDGFAHEPEYEYHNPVGYGAHVQSNRRAFRRWLAEVERAAAEKLEAELEARIEDRDYWYGAATEAKDQRDAALSAVANVEAFAEGLMHDGVEPYTRIGKAIGNAIKAALGSVPSTGEGNE